MKSKKLENVLLRGLGIILTASAITFSTYLVKNPDARKQLADAFKSAMMYNYFSEEIDKESVRDLKKLYRISEK
jgi:hypothetical protein